MARFALISIVVLFLYVRRCLPEDTRAIINDQPRIITQDGHLIFQTAANHNISFEATQGGYVIVGGIELKSLAQMVKQNKAQLDAQKDLSDRLRRLEEQLANHQQTATQLAHLTDRVNQIERRYNSTSENEPLGRISRLERRVNRLMRLLNEDECESHPCRNGGTCVDHYNGYICHCPSAWQGEVCDKNVNECSTLAGTDLGCQNGATCQDNDGGFSCQCAANWYGIRCSESHDDCTATSHEALCGHGTCINTPRVIAGQPKFRCICEDGWTTNNEGACTVDVDECQTTHACSLQPPVQCINIPGSFRCANCPAGYTGNGHVCYDIDECLTDNGGCMSNPRVTCTNTIGSRHCGPCPPGFVGDGVNCAFVGICNAGDNGGCHPLATCRETAGIAGRSCICPSGYSGSGEGATGCTAIADSCSSNPCMHGSCEITGSNYRCHCEPAFTGRRCETVINFCESDPCQNGGTCLNSLQGLLCSCTDDYTGVFCQDQQQSCGGHYHNDAGAIRYPEQQGEGYSHGAHCVWVIEVSTNKIVSLQFTSFDLEDDENCNYDRVKIHDGSSSATPLLGRYCGSELPLRGGAINSTSNSVYLQFESDESVTRDGFELRWRAVDIACGGLLEGHNSGTINSPNFPLPYSHSQDCVWTVNIDPFNVIRFTFSSLTQSQSRVCTAESSDYVTIQDGRSANDAVIGRYCMGKDVQPVQTSGRYARVHFHSNMASEGHAFQIHFSAIPASTRCGSTMTNDSGTFSSPGYPMPYSQPSSCVWTILPSGGERMNFTFRSVDLPSTVGCQHNYVELRNGPTEASDFVGRYCGNELPPPYVSTSGALWVKFVSDATNRGTGFQAAYSTVCGGTFSSQFGVLKSPHYPNRYPLNKRCVYIINQPEGSTIALRFQSFNVGTRTANGCTGDYVELRLGPLSSSPLHGKWCGELHLDTMILRSNLLRLTFVSDSVGDGAGFNVFYAAMKSSVPATGRTNAPASDDDEEDILDTCGGVMTSPQGVFTSPGHPGSYPHGANCTWSIMVAPGSVIRLTFNEFHLEQSPRCLGDRIEVYDNYTKTNMVGSYCGEQRPPVVTSTSNVLTVVFISDSSISHEGFSASYLSVNTSSICGFMTTTPTGQILSPNYPDNYPPYAQCVWQIKLQPGMQIKLTVNRFELESINNCIFDFLQIRDGGYATSPLLGQYCGSAIEPTILSQSNQLYLMMKTDAWSSAPGFNITYEGMLSGCGGKMTGSSGAFVSPNYPHVYNDFLDCEWSISVAAGNRIKLTFVDFKLQSSGTHAVCSNDYVEVRERDRNGPSLARYCGSLSLPSVTSDSNQLFIKFFADSYIHDKGFSAVYHTECSNHLTTFPGAIESPNFPDSYPFNTQCAWVVETTRGNSINATFSHFDIVSRSSCHDDYLEVRDGTEESSPLIGRYCESTLPPFIATSSSGLYVKFVSNDQRVSSGFRMEYIVNGCGGELRGQSGNITSPMYPEAYPSYRECLWTITVAPGHRVQLVINDLDLERHVDCEFGSLEVFGGESTSSPLLTKLCHSQNTSQQVASTGNSAVVRFKSSGLRTGRGFSATYQALHGGCGGNFSTPTGTISSPNYPRPYPLDTECGWLITVATGRTVVLTFQHIDLPENCNADYIEVYDGASSAAPRLARLCGTRQSDRTNFTSTGNQMYVKMKAESVRNKNGFLANYKSGCGGFINAATPGALVTPGWPGHYEKNLHCVWTIYAGKLDGHVTVNTLHFDLQKGDCTSDYMLLYEGEEPTNTLPFTHCGNFGPPQFTSTGNTITLVFVTDDEVEMSGIRALYSSSWDTCGGDITNEEGMLTSPQSPLRFSTQHDVECVWTLRTSPGSAVHFTLQYMDIESDALCNGGYLEIREDGPGGRLRGHFCRNEQFSTIIANSLWLRYRLTADSTRSSFRATYRKVYGGEITGSEGEIASPLYPRSYFPSMDVSWNVITDLDKVIRVEFITLSIPESSTGCDDYVALSDLRQDSTDVVDGRFCSFRSNIAPVYTTTNTLRVHFHSSARPVGVASRGFLLRWTAVLASPANATANETTRTEIPLRQFNDLIATNNIQNFTSPGFPQSYRTRLHHTWMIRADPGHRIWINFTTMDLETSRSCSYDFVRIEDKNETGVFRTGNICKLGNNSTYLSEGHVIRVQFITDRSVSNRGFVAEYKTVCGGLILGMYGGRLTSPGYPSVPYPAGTECVWRLWMPGRTIQLQFDAISVGNAGQCTGDHVELLNGGVNGSPIGDSRYCGDTVKTIPESSGGSVTIKFKGQVGGNTGFSLRYHSSVPGCGGHVTLSSDDDGGVFITSPHYPEKHPPNIDCIWIVRSLQNQPIQIEAIGEFPPSRFSCSSCVIRDGTTAIAPLLATFCDIGGSTVKSVGPNLYVRYRSTVQTDGFKLKLSLARCGGRITATSGSILSPGYPVSYASNQDCYWEVNAPSGHYLSFVLDYINLDVIGNCSQGDYVRIVDGNATGVPIMTFCGRSVPLPNNAVNTSYNRAVVHFHANSVRSGHGFKLNFVSSVESCGGEMFGSGVITSPYYPRQYPHARRCVWKLHAPAIRRVTLTFTDLDIEQHDLCILDNIRILNGVDEESPSLRDSLCGTMLPPAVQSTGNAMTVKFSTNRGNAGRGFSASFHSQDEAVCGGYIPVGQQAGIISPTVANDSYSTECTWWLSNERGEHSSLVLTFLSLNITNPISCFSAFVEIHERDSSNADLIGRYCDNTTVGIPIVSPRRHVKVHFVVNHNSTANFQLQYKASDCGGDMRTSSGVIHSPGYPLSYSGDTDCMWLLTVPEENQIEVIFEGTSAISQPDTFVEVYNGGLPTSPSMGRYLNGTLSPTITSQGHALRVKFQSREGAQTQFVLSYTISSGCGGLLHGLSGVLHSPNYPALYPSNVECEWQVTVPVGYHVELSFSVPFDLQIQHTCDGDYVEVSHIDTPEPVRYCGHELPPHIVSSEREMSVSFQSDGDIQGRGFSANYTAVCGNKFRTSEGVIFSPGYPNRYPKRLHCGYLIENSSPNTIVLLSFSEFQLENARSCQFDYVKVFAGNDTSAKLLGTFCGRRSIPILKSDSSMYVLFASDGSGSESGFVANFTTYKCGGVLNGTSGTITSMSHPQQYMHNTNCTWLIHAPGNRIIKLKFTSFNLEYNSACRFDYVAAYDGDSRDSPLIGKFCGDEIPDIIRSSQDNLLLVFKTDSSVSREGFSAVYESVLGPQQGCGGYLNDTSGSFASVDVDENGRYEPYQECKWRIVTAQNTYIRLRFDYFDLYPQQGGGDDDVTECSPDGDYMAVHDGFFRVESLIGRYCGSRQIADIRSEHNMLLVSFQSDGRNEARGFRATYEAVPLVCGGLRYATDEKQTITSPNYPGLYPADMRCSWLIDAPEGEKVNIEVDTFSLGESYQLGEDSLQIVDLSTRLDKQALMYGGNMTPPNFHSVGRTVRVLFSSNDHDQYTGFSLTYDITKCNRTYSGLSGRIVSPNWPDLYHSRSHCQMLISVPDNYKLSIYFDMMDIESHRSCQYDHLQVFDGSTSNNTVLASLCGSTIPNPIFTDSNVVTVKFSTDSTVRKKGFVATYIASQLVSGCGGVLRTNNGSFTSPGFPGNQSTTLSCHWLVQVAELHVVTIRFSNFEVGSHDTSCVSNFVKVYNGDSQDGTPVGTYCGSMQPAEYTSTSNSVMIVYQSSPSNTGIGFRITYTSH